MGGPLKSSIACSIQRDIVIYDTNASLITPKASWTAHEDLLCLLRRNPYSISIFSGSWNGSLYLWDLKTKPTTPTLKFMKHERAITSAEMINENILISSSADASIFLWDLRNTALPIQSMCPDGKSILNLKVNSDDHLIAFATLKVI
jgi:WD40 repeat protein